MTETQAKSGTGASSDSGRRGRPTADGTPATGRAAAVGGSPRRSPVPASSPGRRAWHRRPEQPPAGAHHRSDGRPQQPSTPGPGSRGPVAAATTRAMPGSWPRAVAGRRRRSDHPRRCSHAAGPARPGQHAAPGWQHRSEPYAAGAASRTGARSAPPGSPRPCAPPRSTVSSAASRGPRRARLNLKRIDPGR